MMTVSLGVMNLILAVIVERAAEARANDQDFAALSVEGRPGSGKMKSKMEKLLVDNTMGVEILRK